MAINIIDADDISNDGERLIPFLSHDDSETIRHIASHSFFKQIIINDIKHLKIKDLSLLDLGFGTGYASLMYANIEQVASVKSIDVSAELLEWAKNNYHSEKINYEICDAREFLQKSKPYSYILTRHVLEHIEDGLNIIKEKNFSNRLCINVPYNEAKGNPYHVLTGITKNDFPDFKNVEFFYEDLNGNTYSKIPKSVHINSIICVASKNGMPRVKDYFTFPLAAPTIKEIFYELSNNNFSFVENLLAIQNDRVLKGREAIDKCKVLKAECEEISAEVKTLKRDNLSLQKELDGILNSKRWKYSSKLADAKKIMRKK